MATIADERSVQMLVVWLKLSLELNQTAAGLRCIVGFFNLDIDTTSMH